MPIRRLFIFALFGLSTAGLAGPAPWYWWVSQLDGGRVCHQTAPGDGWVQETTPFKDVRCRVRLGSP